MMDGSGRRRASTRVQHVMLLVIGALVGCFLTIDMIGSAAEDSTTSAAVTQGAVEAEAVTIVTPALTCHHAGTQDAAGEIASPCAQVPLSSAGSLRAPDPGDVTVDVGDRGQQLRCCGPVFYADSPSLTGLSISRT